MYYHWHFIVWVMLDDVGSECVQQNVSFYDADWDCSTDSKIGLSAVEKISTFCTRVEIEKIGVPNIQTLVNMGIAIDKHMEE
jgi:hypothetical protein